MMKLAAATLTALFAISAPAFAADAKKDEKKAEMKKEEKKEVKKEETKEVKKVEKKKPKGGC